MIEQKKLSLKGIQWTGHRPSEKKPLHFPYTGMKTGGSSSGTYLVAPVQEISVKHQNDCAVRTGTLRIFIEDNGYGFIDDHQTGKSYFVYRGCLKNKVQVNDQVHFEVEKTAGGFVAANVYKIKSEELK